MEVHRGGHGWRCALNAAIPVGWVTGILLVFALASAQWAYGQYPSYAPGGAFCPPGGPCLPPSFAPGLPPAMPYAPPGYSLPPHFPTQPPATSQTPPTRRDGSTQDRDTQTPSRRQPSDLGSPTAEMDAAAANIAADTPSLSGATGTPTAPDAPIPNAIGDFFGAPGDVVLIQQPGRLGVVEFLPVGGGNFGESLPAQPQPVVTEVRDPQGNVLSRSFTIPNSQVVFDVIGAQRGFGSINAQGGAITRQQIGTLLPGDSFRLDTGDATAQNAIRLRAIQQESARGTVTLLGGEATLATEDGYSDGLSNINTPILVDLNANGIPDPGEFYTGDQFFIEQFYLFFPEPVRILVPNPGSGGAIGKVKLAENNSARPQNRVFFDYQFFSSVPLLTSGVDVTRITPGFEKTFIGPLGNLASFEVRVPMGLTLSSEILADAANDLESAEMGNLSLAVKFLFYEAPLMQMAFGMGLTLPTAEDVSLSLADGTKLIEIDNQAVHITPYVAALFTPSYNVFGHAFVQLDYDTNGSAVSMNPDGSGLRHVGRLTDQTTLYLDGSIGYWLYRNDDAFFSGVAGMAELHYNKTLEHANTVASGNLVVGDRNANVDLINSTLGAHVRIGQTVVTNGVSFPLNKSESLFDWEYRLFVNRYY